MAAYAVEEAQAGVDLNGGDLTGDGALNDHVLRVGTRSGGVVNTGMVDDILGR